jgi:hypothetical protein
MSFFTPVFSLLQAFSKNLEYCTGNVHDFLYRFVTIEAKKILQPLEIIKKSVKINLLMSCVASGLN